MPAIVTLCQPCGDTVASSEDTVARCSVPDPQRFFNRHLSWMQFNQRVFEEARDADSPRRASFACPILPPQNLHDEPEAV